jgi:hypothetical protein
MLQMCASVKADGTVILGRGITDAWLNSGVPIRWENVRINHNKKMDFSIQKAGGEIHISLKGDDTEGNILVDIPMFVNNIQSAASETGELVKKDDENGKVWFSGNTKDICVRLKR